MSAGGNIKVVVRTRPFNARERDRSAKCLVSMKDNQTILTPPPQDGKSKPLKAALEGTKTFAFDRSYWSFDKDDPNYAGQEDLFQDLGKPLLENAFKGYNNCIFAYGQTGSGKSYSMMGYGEEEGVIPKICRSMFETIEETAEKDKLVSTVVEVSYIEIYNERVRDLLNPRSKGNLKVREHPATGPYVEDLAKLVVRNFVEIEHLMDEGNKARTVAATNMNETSSRSHAVFTLTLTQKRHDGETNMDTEKVAKISLVDLAGSERATSTGATGARLKEGAEINRSLSTLGRVIAALADLSSGKSKKGAQIPYRDSVLTWLLKDSLGGNSQTAMIAAISPADINYEETLSTLRYADSAKRIKNHAVVNEDPNARMIRELKEELAQLRAKLSGGGAVGGVPEEQYSADTPLDQQFVTFTNADGTVQRMSKADITDQLSQSEKLYKDLNQTWEEKLTMTEQIHKEREAALEELGISIEKGFIGLSTPKKMPHLVNLSDDPLLAECLVYNLKPGTTTVGNVDTNAPSDDIEHAIGRGEASQKSTVDIRLNGSKILHDHCTFENVDGIVTVVPKDGAAIMVNGIRIEAPKRLHSGYRVILGDFHIFRFNHPQEARQERLEHGSMLRFSTTADELDKQGRNGAHERTSSVDSRTMSDDNTGTPGIGSPSPFMGHGRDDDWAFARREAVSHILGSGQKINNLTDDELDVLFDDLQKVRAGRKARPESRFFDVSGTATPTRALGEEDSESVSSHQMSREKYLSNGTLDNFSLDTTLTIPSTPQHPEEEDRLKVVREEMQKQLEQQKEEYQQRLQTAEGGSVEIEELRAERIKMEASLQKMKDEMQRQLREQKAEFHKQLHAARMPRKLVKKADGTLGLSERDVWLAKWVYEHWRAQRYVIMAAHALRNASLLKEAQVMSQSMERGIVFQFTVVDVGHTFGSSYDLALNGLTMDESDDPALESASKPCLAVRVIDFNRSVIRLWSLKKLEARVRTMRQMQQHMDRPEYLQHFRIEDAFEETCMPEHTRVGDADIPLAAVFECRVQDFTLDVYSPYTCSVIGIVHLSLEPSSAEAPRETLKFNVVMHEMVGFAEREGTCVHAQLSIPGISDEGGATTTSLITEFGEGAIRFESVHSMSLPLSAPHDASLRVSIFAKVTSMHLDKLLSWDDMRDASNASVSSYGRSRLGKRGRSRIPEHEFLSNERHDTFARVQILEIGETGNYEPVEVVQNSFVDSGAYQLHQGLQRRFVVDLTCSTGDQLPWHDVDGLCAGSVHLLDANGKVNDSEGGQKDVQLSFVSAPQISQSDDGTANVRMVAQWDSSMHGSLLLDRPTTEKQRVRLTLKWRVASLRTTVPMKFAFDVAVQMHPRTWFRQNSLLAQLWHNQRVVRSTTGSFSIILKPAAAKAAGDLWRMDTTGEYITGEEMLAGWAPRGISLITDFYGLRKRQRRIAEIEAARGTLSMAESIMMDFTRSPAEELSEEQQILLRRVLDLWQRAPKASDIMLLKSGTQSPTRGSAVGASNTGDGDEATAPKPLAATTEFNPKNPSLLKGGWLLSPDEAGSRWIRRYVELRKPYLHLYSSDGDEINAINLTNSRIDAEPQVGRLLQRDNVRLDVWAVYATNKSWLFACRNDRERGEWIWAVDRAYVVDRSSGSQTPERY